MNSIALIEKIIMNGLSQTEKNSVLMKIESKITIQFIISKKENDKFLFDNSKFLYFVG